uniref:Pyrrolo-quinoline quinone repeat domain-containing protein n=1 Tax=Mesoaciditoga lauensis TaxID=1495039 RepID=A0A7V3RE38_9BACT
MIWYFATDGNISSAPAIGDDEIFIGTDQNGFIPYGYLYALTLNGTIKWYQKTNGMVSTTPTVGAGGTVYFGTQNGYIYAINGNGSLKWEFKIGSIMNSSPVIVTNGTMYIGSLNGYIYAIKTDSKGISNSSWPTFQKNISHSGGY